MARAKRYFILGYTVGVSGQGKLWISSIALGSKALTENLKAPLRVRTRKRDIIEAGKGYQLREILCSYKALFRVENEDIDLKRHYI